MAFNDLWCLTHPEIHTLSLGAARPSDFDAHVEALELLPRADELLPPIVARLEAAYRDALGEDFARRWRIGLREWHELPGKVNVRRILWLENLVRAYDLLDFAQERYASLSPDDHWVPGARAPDRRCRAHGRAPRFTLPRRDPRDPATRPRPAAQPRRSPAALRQTGAD
jgi:predicted aldo/keto reductase-like oxidoreductase